MKKNILSFALSILIPLIVIEFILRIFWKPAFLDPKYMRDDFAWILGNISLNRFGYRDEEAEIIKKEGMFRIYCLGDSYTYGWYIDNPNNVYPEALEQKLIEKYNGQNIEAINASRAGFDLEDSVVRLENEGVMFSPDLVIIGINVYDLLQNEYYPKLTKNKFLRNLRLYQLTFGNLERIKAGKLNQEEMKMTYIKDSEQLQKTKTLLKRAKTTTDSIGAELVLIIFPPFNASNPNGEYINNDFVNLTTDISKELSITSVDLSEAFVNVEDKTELVLNPTDPHLTELANKAVAEHLLNTLDFDKYLNLLRNNQSIAEISIKQGTILSGFKGVLNIEPFGWVWFDRKNDLGTQKIFLPNTSDRKTEYLEDKLLSAKLNTHDGWEGAKIEYHILGTETNFEIPKTLYGYEVLGVEKVKKYFRVDGAQRSEEIDLSQIGKQKEKVDYYELIVDINVNQFDIENETIVEVKRPLEQAVVEYIK